jgi:hypothetical protein
MSIERKDKNERRIVGSANGNIRNTKEGEKEGIFPGAWPYEDRWLFRFKALPSISRCRGF